MVDHDAFDGTDVADGDTMSDGWFDGCYEAVANTTTGHDHDGTNSRKIDQVAYLADNETITGEWVFRRNIATDTRIVIDSYGSGYDSQIDFLINGSSKWRIKSDDSASGNLRFIDLTTGDVVVDFEINGDIQYKTNITFDTTTRQIGGVENIQLHATYLSLKQAIYNSISISKSGAKTSMEEPMYTFDLSNSNEITTTGSPDTDTNTYSWNASGTITTKDVVWTGDTINYGLISAKYCVCDTYDEFDDGSVDTNLWTTSGTVTESGGYMTVNRKDMAAGTSSAYTKTNLNSYDVFFMKVRMYTWVPSAGTADTYIEATDNGTNFVTLHHLGSGVGTAYNYLNVFKIIWNSNEKIAYVYKDSVLQDVVDCSSLSDNNFGVRFRAVTNANDNDAYMDIHYLRKRKSSFGSTISFSLSVDGGTNYESCTEDKLHQFTNTGTTPKCKITYGRSGDEYLMLEGFGMVFKS